MEASLSGNLAFPKNMSHLCRDLLKSILVADPNLRPELADIKQHKMFKPIQWTALQKRSEPAPFVPPLMPATKSETCEETKVLCRNSSSNVLGDYQYHVSKINRAFKDF